MNSRARNNEERNDYVTNRQRDDDRCSIVYRQENISTNFRMLALAIFMLFGLCTLLFIWNIVLSNQVNELQQHVTSLAKSLHKYEEMTSSQSDVRHSKRRKRHEVKRSERDKRSGKIGKEVSELRIVDNEFTTNHRTKRSSVSEEEISSLVLPDSQSTILSREKRGKKKGGRGGKCKGKKRSRKCRQLPPPAQTLPKATAFHVGIKSGAPPYQGKVVGQYIRTWDLDPSSGYVNEGFNINELNDQYNSEHKNELGKVVVQTTGYYFVYGQVVFKPDRPVDVSEKFMIGMTGSREFVSCIITTPRDLREEDYVACHSSGVVFLHEDEVFGIKISPSNIKVYMSRSHTYFGAFLIGG